MTIKQFLFISGILCFLSVDLSGQEGASKAEKSEASFIEGTMLLVLEKYEEANTIFLRLLKEDKQNATLNFQISRCYLGLDKKVEGIEFARKAAQLDPNNTYFFEQLVDLLLDEGMLSEATVYAEKLYLLEPQNDLYFNHLISILAHQESYEALTDVIQGKIDTYGASPDLYLKLAGTQMKMGKYKKAENSMNRALEEFPKELEVHVQLIAYYADRNEDSKAKDAIDRFLVDFPQKEKYLFEIPKVGKLINGASESDNPLAAIINAPQLSLDQKIKEIIPYLTAFVNEQNTDAKQILMEIIDDLESQYPEEPKVKAIKGDLYFYAEDYKQAINAYEDCLNYKKNLLAVWEHLLYAYYHTENVKTMLERADDALLYFPNQAAIWYYYALSLVENHQYEDALYEIEGYTYLISGNLQQTVNAHILKSRCYLAQNQLDKALGEIDAGIEVENKAGISKGNPYLAIYQLIILAEDPSKKTEAKKLSLKLDNLNSIALYQYAKAKSLLQNDEANDALEAINIALTGKHPVTGDFHELKGDIHLKLDQKDLAQKAYLLAIEKNGNPNRINLKLNRLR